MELATDRYRIPPAPTEVRLEGAQAVAAPVVVMGYGLLPVAMAEPMAQAVAELYLVYIPEATEVLGR
jgi:hypothetical protein